MVPWKRVDGCERSCDEPAVRFLGLAVFAYVVACVPPAVVEESALACSNGIDDDGDGFGDCQDGDCDSSGACESTQEACRNGLDEDENGRADCEDVACIERSFCLPFAAQCTPIPQTGCPRGMGCYVVNDTDTECRLAGDKQFGASCSAPAPAETHPCGAGFQCIGACTAFCLEDSQCPRESFCITSPYYPFGLCALPCDPPLLSDGRCINTDDRCVSGHQWESQFLRNGVRWFCLELAQHEGAAQAGDPCDDPPGAATPETRICPWNLACAPDANGDTRCRELCAINTQDGEPFTACAAGQDCVIFNPLDNRPQAPFDTLVLGACLER